MEFLQIISNVVMKNSGYVFPFMAVMTRISVFVFLLPGLGETAISARIRLVAALMISWLVAPLVMPGAQVSWGLGMMAATIGLEALYGFFLGFSLRIMVFTLQITGAIISQSLSLTQMFGGGMTSEPNTSVSTILMLGGVTILLTLDLHTKAVGLLLQAYETFPLGHVPDTEKMAYYMAQKCMGVFKFAVALALPFLVLNFIYNLMLGFVNKAMPQLMVSFVGMPFITGVGILLLAMSTSGILVIWQREYTLGFAGVF